MRTPSTADPRAWRADTVDQRQHWFYPLSPPCLAELDESIQRPGGRPRATTEMRAARSECPACAQELGPVRTALESGRGFAILRGLTHERYSPEELQARYWLLGQLLGRPVEQNVQGTLLYDVRDTGQDVRSGARFSVTNAQSGFHTDNSFGPSVVDYVGLLCLRTARRGGLSQAVSGYSVYRELLARRPDVLEALARPWHIDRRGGLRPGEAPTAQYPVLSRDGRGLTYRYLRYWVESGHDKAGQPLDAARREALDALDAVLGDPALRAEFALEPGDLFLVNNRWVLHNRTAFEDHPEPGRGRHLVRLWLRAGDDAG
jgi:alpha-ketoglutarate-dependent taurine dioxygenase